MKIGFIGLGIMGKPMAKNLMKAGHELVVYDVIAANVDNVVAAGAQAGASSKDVAEQCSFIITMLPNSPHVKTVVMGENGVLEGAQAGTVLVDMSSIAPLASQEIAAACGEKGVKMLDAPVSGGEPKAIDGTLATVSYTHLRAHETVLARAIPLSWQTRSSWPRTSPPVPRRSSWPKRRGWTPPWSLRPSRAAWPGPLS